MSTKFTVEIGVTTVLLLETGVFVFVTRSLAIVAVATLRGGGRKRKFEGDSDATPDREHHNAGT